MLGIGGAADLLGGLGCGIKSHGTHGMGEVQRLAAPRIGNPGGRVDSGAAEIDQKEPRVLAALLNALLKPVIKGVHRLAAIEMKAGKVDLHDPVARMEDDATIHVSVIDSPRLRRVGHDTVLSRKVYTKSSAYKGMQFFCDAA